MIFWAVPARTEPIVTNRRMHRVDFPGDECLNRRDQDAGDHHGVYRLVRTRPVSPLASDMDREAVGLGGDSAGRDHDFANFVVMSDVTGKDRRDVPEDPGPQ